MPAPSSAAASSSARFASGASGTAIADLDNNGSIVVAVDASATGLSAIATASISGAGIRQAAIGADLAVAALNNSGAIEITAEADAGNAGTSTFAGAFAFINTGISQFASAFASRRCRDRDARQHRRDPDLRRCGRRACQRRQRNRDRDDRYGDQPVRFASSAANVNLVNDGTIDVLADAVRDCR